MHTNSDTSVQISDNNISMQLSDNNTSVQFNDNDSSEHFINYALWCILMFFSRILLVKLSLMWAKREV